MKKFLMLIAGFIVSVNCFASNPDIVVAADGTGDFTTIQAAINSCRHFLTVKTVIFVKNGTYAEKIEVPSWITGVEIRGEDREKTIIANDDYSSKVTALGRLNTFTSYTLKVSGNRTHLVNLTIANNAPQLGQAVALHIEADGVLVSNCNITGNQDTLYATGEKNEVLITDCYIEGTTDFIFGSAKLFAENCAIHCKRNSYITAASTPQGRDFGFAIFDSKITAAADIDKVYLGRPWRIYAQTVFLNCSMGDFIRPEGWENWGKPEAESTAFYAEYGTTGTSTANRVAWSKQLTKRQAAPYYAELKAMKKRIGK